MKKEGVSGIVDLQEVTVQNAKEKMIEWVNKSDEMVVFGVMVSFTWFCLF